MPLRFRAWAVRISTFEEFGVLRGHFKYVTTQGSALVLATAITQLFGLVVLFVYHECGVPGGYGAYNLILAFMSVIAMTTLSGMNTAILVGAAQGKPHLLRTATRRRVQFSLLIGWPVLLVVGVGILLAVPQRSLLGYACLIALPLFPFAYAFEGVYGYLNGRRQFWLLAKAQIAFGILSFLAVALCVIYWPGQILVPPLVYLAVKAILETGLYIAVVRWDRIAPLDEDRKLVTYGMKVTLTGMAGTVEARLNRIIVGLVYGVVDLDSFAAGRALTLPLRQMLSIYRNLYTPKLAQKRPAEALRQTHRALAWAFLGLIPLFAGAFLLLPWVFDTFLAKFGDGALYARWYLISMLLGLPVWFFFPFLQAQRKARHQVMIMWVRMLVHVVTLVLFAVRFGIIGILYSQAVTVALQSLHCAAVAQLSRREE